MKRGCDILIADDHAIFRLGLRQLIEAESAHRVVAECADGTQVLSAIRTHTPDVVLQDIDMPGADGLVLLSQAMRWSEPPVFVMLTMHSDTALAQRALELGALAYLVKDQAELELLDCLQAVRAGQIFVSQGLGVRLARPDQPRLHTALDALTPTELRILRLIAQYKTSREIGALLNVSHRTVQNHRANIAAKLQLRGANALLQFALENLATQK